jgi:hypothetical protein
MNKSRLDTLTEKLGQAYLRGQIRNALLVLGWAYVFGIPYFVFQCYTADQKFLASSVLALWIVTIVPVYQFLKKAGQLRADPSQARSAIIVIILTALVVVLALSSKQ